MPLGGTSNHFRTEVLRDIGGWDAFNVTEDADLGVRLARRGLRAATFSSRTFEEAPLTLPAWMAQRTRWMKGWMQTFIVHNRAPRVLLRELGWRGFRRLPGAGRRHDRLVAAAHGVRRRRCSAACCSTAPNGFMPRDGWDWVSVGILVVGYGGAFAVVVSGLARQRALHLLAGAVAAAALLDAALGGDALCGARADPAAEPLGEDHARRDAAGRAPAP